MASDVVATAASLPAASLAAASLAAAPLAGPTPSQGIVQPTSGSSLPASGSAPPPPKAAPDGFRAPQKSALLPESNTTVPAKPAVQQALPSTPQDPQTLVAQLNKYVNNSGRPDQFRVDPASGGKLIQQINPATGAVVGEFSASEFEALARGVADSGFLIDSLA